MGAMREAYLKSLVQKALQEDVNTGDITTDTLVPLKAKAKGVIVFKTDAVVCGLHVARTVVKHLDPKITFKAFVTEGTYVKKGTVAASMSGSARGMLTAERVALNFLTHCSSIATRTRGFVEKVRPFKAKILDTRKTTPLLRELERYAVRTGGGVNHRFDLAEMAMIKDNHRSLLQGKDKLIQAVDLIRTKTGKRVVLEIDALDELQEALLSKAQVILLDNMTPPQVAEAVRLRNKLAPRVLLEASGGINIDNVRAYAKAGADRISIGSLTAVRSGIDISLDFVI